VGVSGESVAEHRRHGGNTPSAALYRGSLRIVDRHLAGASGRTRRLLLERRVDALWGLGEFDRARREAFAALCRAPLLPRRPLAPPARPPPLGEAARGLAPARACFACHPAPPHMTRIALLTEIPAPYRLPLFRALARVPGVELRVLFLASFDPRRSYPVLGEA